MEKREPEVLVMGQLTLYGVFKINLDICACWAHRSWEDKTRSQYLRYLVEVLIPYIPNHDYRPAKSFRKEELEAVVEKVRTQGHPVTGKKYKENTLKSFSNILRSISFGVEMLHLGENVYGSYARASRSAQADDPFVHLTVPRSLTPTQEVKLVRNLLSHLDKKENSTIQGYDVPAGAFVAVYLMLIAGVRNGEACGLTWGHLKCMKRHPEVYTLTIVQSEKSKSKQIGPGGKSQNAVRSIPLLRNAVQPLLELKVWEEQKIREEFGDAAPPIDQVPIALGSPDRDGPSFCKVSQLILAATAAFQEIGIRSKNLSQLAEDLWKEEAMQDEENLGGTEQVKFEKEPTAYILRRHFGTTLYLLGFQEQEIQYLMGHKIEDPRYRRRDFRDEDILFRMYTRMKGRAIFEKIEETEKVQLTKSEEIIQIEGSKDVSIEADLKEGERLAVQVQTHIPGDQIEIKRAYRVEGGRALEEYSEWPSTMQEVGRIDMTKRYRRAYMEAHANEVFFKPRRKVDKN